MAMRAQLSLVFEDEELYTEFIQPFKEQKALHGVILKCLSAYYYNEEVRNLIEGSSLEDVSDGGAVASSQSICDNIRASLAMQSFLATELQQTIDTGTEDITNILHKTNEFAQKSGVAQPTTSEYGGGILQIEMNNGQSGAQQQSSVPSGSPANMEALCSLLFKAVEKLAVASGNNEVTQMLGASNQPTPQVETPVITETKSYEHGSQGSSAVIDEIPVSPRTTVVVEEPVELVQETTPIIVEEPIQEVKEEPVVTETAEDTGNSSEDATDALNDLLGSLGF